MKKFLFIIIALIAVTGAVGGNYAYFTDTATTPGFTFTAGYWGPQEVKIDIEPGEYPNYVNPKSNELIKVAVLSSRKFDALLIDVETVRFGPAGASGDKRGENDVNGDGRKDLELGFHLRETGIQEGDTEAVLTGETVTGVEFTGSDSIETK
jgi:predicted ribosomally synthesized peptide with SipW-like signal peptide